MTKSIEPGDVLTDPLLIKPKTSHTIPNETPAASTPISVVTSTVAPAVNPAAPSQAPVKPPKAQFKITNQNVVVNNGGSGRGVTVTTRRHVGRDTITVQERLGTGDSRSLRHHAIHLDQNGVEHVIVRGKYVKLSNMRFNIVRRETVNRG